MVASVLVAGLWLAITRSPFVFYLTAIGSVAANWREERIAEALSRALLVGTAVAVGNLYLYHPR